MVKYYKCPQCNEHWYYVYEVTKAKCKNCGFEFDLGHPIECIEKIIKLVTEKTRGIDLNDYELR
jgi:hypothetical protein